MKKNIKYGFIFIMIFMLLGAQPLLAKPQAPKFLKIEEHRATHTKTPTCFYLHWSSSVPDNHYFVIEKKLNDGNWTEIERKIEHREQKFYFDQAITPNMNYCYRVKLKGKYRNDGSPTWIETESDYCDAVCQKAPCIPLRPTNLHGTIHYPQAGKVKFVFNWKDNATNEFGYEVELINKYGYTLNKQYLPANSSSIDLTYSGNTVDPLTVRLRSYNMYYSAYSQKCTLTPKADLIPVPQNFRLSGVDSKSVRLVWFNPINYRDIRVERRYLGKAFEMQKKKLQIKPEFKFYKWVQGTPVPSFFEDTGIEPGSRYEYRISGRLNVGESKFTDSVAASTQNPTYIIPMNPSSQVPAGPINLRIVQPGPSAATLSWVDKSTNEDGFMVEVKAGHSASFQTFSTVKKDVTQLSIKGLKPGAEYAFRVRAFNTKGQSKASNTVKIHTGKTR